MGGGPSGPWRARPVVREPVVASATGGRRTGGGERDRRKAHRWRAVGRGALLVERGAAASAEPTRCVGGPPLPWRGAPPDRPQVKGPPTVAEPTGATPAGGEPAPGWAEDPHSLHRCRRHVRSAGGDWKGLGLRAHRRWSQLRWPHDPPRRARTNLPGVPLKQHVSFLAGSKLAIRNGRHVPWRVPPSFEAEPRNEACCFNAVGGGPGRGRGHPCR